VRDYSDVRDVVRAYLVLLEKGKSGEAYNVASGRGVALREALDMLRARARVAIEVVESGARLRPADLSYLVGDWRASRRSAGRPAMHSRRRSRPCSDGARRETGAPVQGGA
jgi:GDP-4-dehydro-6-deoxy-D-mannose reductase